MLSLFRMPSASPKAWMGSVGLLLVYERKRRMEDRQRGQWLWEPVLSKVSTPILGRQHDELAGPPH